MSNARMRFAAIAIVALALTLRAAHLASIAGTPVFTNLGLDLQAYDTWAREIAAGDWLGDEVFYQDPLYPYFLAALYALLGPARVAVVALQMLLGCLAVLMVLDATRRWFGDAESVVAGLLAATYLPSIYYEGLILKTWIDVFLMAAVLWSLSRAVPEGRSRHWAASGLLLGLACLSRSNLLLLLPVLAAWVRIDPSARRRADRWRAPLALLLGAGVVLGATALRNRVVGGEWVVTTAQAGQNFYLGNNPLARSGRYDALPFVRPNPKFERIDFAREAERRNGRAMGASEISAYWRGQAVDWILSNPSGWLRLTWRKFRIYWEAYEIPDNLDYYVYAEAAPILRLPLPGFGLLVPLAALGGLLALRRPGWPRAPLFAVLVNCGSVVLFFVFARYRMAMMPALFPLAGYGAAELWRRLARCRRRDAPVRDAALAVATVLAAFAFVNLPVRMPRGTWQHALASAIRLPVRPESTVSGQFNLGLIQAEAADAEALRAAETALRHALARGGEDARTLTELAKVLARQERIEEALGTYESAVRLDPDYAPARFGLGVLQRRVGRRAEALAHFRRAAELTPDSEMYLMFLGETLLQEGRKEEARPVFEAVLRVAPQSEPARRGLALAAGPDE